MNTLLFKQPQHSPTREQEKPVHGNGRRDYQIGMPPIGKSRKAKFHTVQDKIRKISGIAWAVLVPTALGIVVGLWMDTLWPAAAYSWVSMLWPIGALIGCLMAMIWVYQDPGTKS